MNHQEESELITSVESGEWSPVSNFTQMKKMLMKAAHETAQTAGFAGVIRAFILALPNENRS